jgi:hypothetical protein
MRSDGSTNGGEIRWQGGMIYISSALAGEPVGLLQDDDGSWSVWAVLLADAASQPHLK